MKRICVRFLMLVVLVTGLAFATTNNSRGARRDDCCTDCIFQRMACMQACGADMACRVACTGAYQLCRGGCGPCA